MTITSQAAQVYRNFIVDGVSGSGNKEPDKGDIRALFAQVDSETLKNSDFTALIGDLDERVGHVVSTSYALVGNGVADDTVAMQAFINNPIGRGYLAPGTYKVTALTIPDNVEIWGPVSAIIIKANTVGPTITLAGSNITLRGFTVDGSASTDTFAGGYIAGHFGIQSAYSGSSPTTVAIPESNIVMDGLTVRNCGEVGIELRGVTHGYVRDCKVTRCGYGGIIFWTGTRCDVDNNNVSNIYPGSGGTAPDLNAYGIVFSNYDTDSKSTYCRARFNRVSDVIGWEGIDEHNGEYIDFIGNTVIGCSQGIVFQHPNTSQPMLNCKAIGNTILGFAGTASRGGQTYHQSGGIIAACSPVGSQGRGLTLNDNGFEQTGDARGVGISGTSGAIKVQNCQAFTIDGNRFYNCYCQAIYLETAAAGADSCIAFQITGNVINLMNTVNSIKWGVRTTSKCLGQVSSNFGFDSGGFSQTSSPANVTTFANNVPA